MTDRKVVLVVGAGDATGGAIARRFAREGFTACVARRNADKLAPLVARIESEGGRARALGSDARREEQMVALVETIEREEGAIEGAAFNIGGNVRFPIRETTARVYFKVWEMCAFAGFLMGREVAKTMVPRGRGTILFTGATASVRGGAGFATFAGGKHALRALSQSMARELLSGAKIGRRSSVASAADRAWNCKSVPPPGGPRQPGLRCSCRKFVGRRY